MALEIKESTCVARGTFNIYIFQPGWIAETLMQMPEGTEGKFSTDLSQPGLQASFDALGLVCTIRPDSAIVTCSSPNYDCGIPVARIMTELPHTPVKAVGNNFTFECERDDTKLKKGLDDAFLFERTNLSGVTRSDVGGAIERDGTTINLALSRTPKKLTLGVNVHRSTAKAADAARAAEAFRTDRRTVVELAMEVFELEVKDD
ncbi:hypothetical protein [Roseimaritima sediminicola]|uniref:hypothetical protein n=1 Tax=Roseimaritima sediminicola TaxID=2662066 RepID=UPI0012982423|nr:hypothetical protein [Roseimaritima sediminicola]